jgi:hypothetical protein
MALTAQLKQVSTAQVSGIQFYSLIQREGTALFWDPTTSTLVPKTGADPVMFTEDTLGNWSWTCNLATVPDGFYTITSYERAQNVAAAEPKTVYLVAGEVATDVALLQVGLNHNFEGTDNLAYRTPDGTGIDLAYVRIYTDQDWQAQALAQPVGVTQTDGAGRWLDTIFVSPGTYHIQFHKPKSFGPDSVQVVV